MRLRTTVLACLSIAASAATISAKTTDNLRFNPDNYTQSSIVMPDGSTVAFKAYEKIFYVTNVEDTTYHTLNIYVPEKLAQVAQVPILLRSLPPTTE